MRFNIERTVVSSSGTHTAIVAGPVKASKMERIILDLAWEEFKHHKKKASYPYATAYVGFGEFEDGSIGFVIESDHNFQQYKYKGVKA